MACILNYDNVTTVLTVPGSGLAISNIASGSVIFAGADGLLSQDNVNFHWNNELNQLTLGGTGTDANIILPVSGEVVFNESGLNTNFRVESDGNTHMLFVDGTGNNIGINTSAPEASALLDLSSTNKGFLVPRLTTAQRDAISSPSDGLIVYNSTSGDMNVYNDKWHRLPHNIVPWTKGGNGITEIVTDRAYHALYYEIDGGQNFLADLIYIAPIFLATSMNVTEMSLSVTATGTATAARFCIYYADELTGLPTVLLLDGGENAALGTTGLKTVSVSITLLPGMYWIGMVMNGTASLSGGRQLATGAYIGRNSAAPAGANTAITGAHSYAALPATFPTIAYLNSFRTPAVYMRST